MNNQQLTDKLTQKSGRRSNKRTAFLKPILFFGLCTLLLMSTTACSWFNKKADNSKKQTVIKNSPKENQQLTVIPQSQTSEKDYQTIRPKTASDTRGYILYGVSNRVDVDEIETQLQDLSKSPFDPSRYYFQEGRYLSTSFIDSLLSRKDGTHPDGLNPPLGKGKDLGEKAANSPKYLSYILEQDYLTKNGNSYQLSGISLGISVNSVYSENLYNKSNGKTYPVDVTLDTKKSMAEAKADATKILQKVRGIKGLGQVPIFIGLYLESEPNSFVPGHYFAKTTVPAGSSSISKWTNVKEQVLLFPSSAATNANRGDSDKFNKFSDDVQSYFPNSIGVIGKGFYKNGNLSQLTVTINERFYDKTETVSFANYVAMLIKDKFPFSQDIPVEVDINSVSQPEAVIVQRPGMDQPFVQVYSMYSK
ncbi:CamS family sex pheromone protein [Pullulanibacillus sp. KACC 23026]|uniref:CamS family sex pheromone protein n=1 Tax=Pullulanibacillus sp. KACC 23026 TaxID=3028315 RepID=UPI0023AEE712|nr:CamS family sex pheromone protein [Pullulanibacillus sp. KACC 23026]WEG12382.1 CamS family sex pheromone protein [Pullulanibacillus sp. KACC 23026]